MVLYRSIMNIGAAVCLVWTWGRGRCGRPRMERISRCISLRSWLRSRRWMKLERTSLSVEKFEKAICATREPKQQHRRSVPAAGALATIVSPLRTAVPGRVKRSTGGKNKIKHSEHLPNVTCVRAVAVRALLMATWVWVLLRRWGREGRGSREVKWDKTKYGKIRRVCEWGCSVHIAALSLSARLYLGNKIAWVWTLSTEVLHPLFGRARWKRALTPNN